MSAGALTLDGVTRRFATQTALDSLTLAVQPGELLALLGASGSGKSTTLRLVAGFERPDAGTITLDGKVINELPPEARGFGMVFQQYALFPHLSVEENVAFGLEARGVAKSERLKRARAALAAVGLQEKAQRPVQALSGGEQQRVALARATVIEPRVLLLDEPLSNLDPLLREAMRDDLRAALRRSGATTLFVTHDQEDAFAVADRIALLSQGKLLQTGTPEELYHRPVSRTVAEFIGHSALFAAIDQGDKASVEIDGQKQTFSATRASGAATKFARSLAVLRPELLTLTDADANDAWRGEVVHARFAGGVMVYRVRFADDALCEVSAPGEPVAVGARVGVRVARGPVAIVPA
ncbi:MAG TPA: ABC transporter ATP-binding protein [Gemmatimonadaceae bacterium]|nr:ABC transporter ATP-binding protein [Gemmatimonadaceae bacterium]